MSTQQVTVPHPLGDGVTHGERTGDERPRADSPFRWVAVEIESGGTWLVREEDIR